MLRYKSVFVFIPCFLFAVCFELSVEKKEKFLNGFVEYLNNLPGQVYTYDEGVLLNAQKTDEGSCYYIEARLIAVDIHNLDSSRYLKCSATIQDLEENGIAVQDNQHQCEDVGEVTQSSFSDDDNLEDVITDEQTTRATVHQPIHLDNEVQPNTGVTSGEEFVAVPRRQYGGTCEGCSSHVNPQAPGVNDLALLAIKHLDRHEPTTKHFLKSVLDVERQVQVVNGVRYIVTLLVDFDNCTLTTSDSCFDSKVCKISILEKTWIKLPDGSKYRAVLSNNCTQEWIFGDEGEYIPNSDVNNENNDIDLNLSTNVHGRPDNTPKPILDSDKIANKESGEEILKAVHNTDVQAAIQTEKSLTEKELKDLEEQVIPYDKIYETSSESFQTPRINTDSTNVKIHHVSQFQTENQNIKNSVKDKQPENDERSSFFNEDRRKAIDDLINFFNSAGFDKAHNQFPRVKRSYKHEIKMMTVAEKVHKIKKNIKKAEYLYSLAQNMVDYLNEMDLEIKTRILLDVIAAEEEFENYQNFFYIQARVVIPCETIDCEQKEMPNKICNGVIEVTDQERPQILNAFCYDEPKNLLNFGKTEMVPLNDPVLLKLTKESLKQIEAESNNTNAMKIEKILQAQTQKVSGRVTKITVSLLYTDCDKTIPYVKRTNCTVIENMDSEVCELNVYERHWLKEKKMTYTCTRRPIDEIFSNKKEVYNVEETIKDSKILEMAQEALQYLEIKSNRNNKQKVIKINSVTTQLIGGLLTEIEFDVGYTTCSNDFKVDFKSCELLDNEPLRKCKAQVWDRPWLEDGRQINVHCDNFRNKETLIFRKKRSTFVGGQKIVDPNNSKYVSLAEESLQQYLKSNDIQDKLEVAKVCKVTVQVVSGTITRIDFKIASKNSNNGEYFCHSSVWERPWLHSKDINVTCESINNKLVQKPHFVVSPNPQNSNNRKHTGLADKSIENNVQGSSVIQYQKDRLFQDDLKNNKRKKRSLKGRKVKQDPSLAEFRLLAQESLRKYQKSQKTKSSNYEVDNVSKVHKQTVSGSKYEIDFTAKPIQCIANGKDNIECNHNEKEILYCHTSIWSRPWLGRNKINVNCNRDVSSEENDDNDRKKRSVRLGASAERDINDENYKLLAEKALLKYQQLSNSKHIHKIIKIHHVSEQVVAGTLTKIEFSISPTKCLIEDSPVSADDCNVLTPATVLRCKADIWNRPWIKSDREIKIDCQKEYSKRSKGDILDKNINNHRKKRQDSPVEDYIDDDTKYYYADRAVQYINDKANTNNIQKLITIHAFQNNMNMGVNTVRMYIETAYTFCIRHQDEAELSNCEELSGMYHRLCYVRLWPSPDDELVIQSMAVICDDEDQFSSVTGISITNLVKSSIKELETSPKIKYKLVHQGEPNVIPSLDSHKPIILSFLVRSTNCSKYIDIDQNPYSCYIDGRLPKSCTSSIWLVPNSKKIKKITVTCNPFNQYRSKRSLSLDSTNITSDENTIQNFVKESLEKLEMSSLHKYKQRVLQINSFNTKIAKGRLTTIDFDVGYTTCLKYEWVDNITQCEFIEHLPRRHCVSQIRERLWINNGREIEVNCEDDETPLEATIEFESAENAMQLAGEVLKHIEFKYPHPRRQKVVRLFSLDKQEVAGVHYRMKLEVGYTDCLALSTKDDCKLVNNIGSNKFCRANIWLRPWTEHPPTYRVSCDYQDGTTNEIYQKIQTEHLFSDFLTTYKPDYINDHVEMLRRYEIFESNVRKIHDFNIHERGTARYAVTRFSDLTYEEFGQKYLGLKPNLRDVNQIPFRKADIPQVHLPDGFDWRQYDAVTEVKNQGSCGSCWAFSVTGNIEGQWKIQSGELVSLSEQELVDCDKLDDGCNGGLPDNAYRAIEQLGGLETENDYPYEAENDKCTFNKTLSRVQIKGAVNITTNETDMAKWLVQNGPISIGINANAMQFYVGGVSHPWRMLCSPKNLDHGVLIVGYGIKDYPLFKKRLPYWIIKNSWGKSWGEQGYYRVYRGDGTCGVNQMASSAIV